MLEQLPLSNRYKHLHFLKMERDHIKMAKDVEEILDILEPYWNYGSSWANHKQVWYKWIKEEMQKYIMELEEFEKTTSVKDFNSAALNKM